jgi:hypothetical protein
MFLKGHYHAKSEATALENTKPQTPYSLQGFRPQYRGVPELSRTEIDSQGLPELRLL